MMTTNASAGLFAALSRQPGHFRWTADRDQVEDPEWLIAQLEDGKVVMENRGTPEVYLRIRLAGSGGAVAFAHPGDVLEYDATGVTKVHRDPANVRLYVLGLLFSDDRETVVLLHKRHGPRHLIGCLNGPGGEKRADESFEAAIEREFCEETGLSVPAEEWTHEFDLIGGSILEMRYDVRIYSAFKPTEFVIGARTMSEEEVGVYGIECVTSRVAGYRPVDNLRWIVPLVLDRSVRRPFFVEIP